MSIFNLKFCENRLGCWVDFLFWAALILSPIQVFTVELFGFYPSLSVLSAWALTPVVGIALFRLKGAGRLVAALLILLLSVQSISLFWSPDLRLGIRTVLYEMVFVNMFIYALLYSDRLKTSFYKATAIFLSVASVQAFAVILFRFFPEVEEAFWGSWFAQVVINPNTLREWDGLAQNNVWDPLKSGGFFNNANIGAVFSGVCFWFARFVLEKKRSVIAIGTGLLFLVAVYCSGSKAAAMILCVLLFVSCCFRGERRLNLAFAGLGLLLTLALYVVPTIAIMTEAQSEISKEAWAELSKTERAEIRKTKKARRIKRAKAKAVKKQWQGGERKELWALTSHQIAQRPVLGMGFGGWEVEFEKSKDHFNFQEGVMPPHNTYLYVWLQSGFLAVALIAGFVFRFFFVWLRLKPFRGGQSASFLGLGLGCCFLQAGIANYYFFGEDHMMPLMAICAALLCGASERARSDKEIDE